MKTAEIVKQIDERLGELLSEKFITNEPLLKASQYTTITGGKRIRPRFLLEVSGGKGLDVACAIELIHNFSLVHDDLPGMDNDELRRGKPTLHRAFDEATAILTGDFLLTKAFELISESDLSSSLKCKLISLVAKRLGSSGLIGGQILDMAAKTKKADWKKYQQIAQEKTSALFACALEAGAIIKGASDEEYRLLQQFGEMFGLIYQIADDFVDIEEPSAVTILGKEKAEKTLQLLIKSAKHLLTELPEDFPFLHESLKKFDPLYV